MIKIEDITKREMDRLHNFEVTTGLIRKHFGKVYIGKKGASISVRMHKEYEPIVVLNPSSDSLTLYREDLLKKTEKFAEDYEDEIMEGRHEFTIQTDYSRQKLFNPNT